MQMRAGAGHGAGDMQIAEVLARPVEQHLAERDFGHAIVHPIPRAHAVGRVHDVVGQQPGGIAVGVQERVGFMQHAAVRETEELAELTGRKGQRVNGAPRSQEILVVPVVGAGNTARNDCRGRGHGNR